MSKRSEESQEFEGFNAENPLDSPKQKFKITDVPHELPLGLFDAESKRWFKGYEVSKMSADVLVSFESEANPYRSFGMLVAKGLKRIYDIETGEEHPSWKSVTSKLFFQDVFYLMLEIIVATRGSSLVATAYRCPQCGKFTKFENPLGQSGGADSEKGFDLLAGEDEFSSLEMEDIRSIPYTSSTLEEPILRFNFDEGLSVGGEVFKEYVFRIPEIGDYIAKGGGNKSGKQVEREVLYKCLIGLNGKVDRDLDKLKNVYGMSLLSLNLKEYVQIIDRLNGIGYNFSKHNTKCYDCGYEYKTTFDLTNFFGSILGR